MMLSLSRHVFRGGAAAVVGVLMVFAVASGAGAQNGVVGIDTLNSHAGEFRVPLNKSQVLRVDQPFSDLRLGNPDIADVLPLTDRTIYVLGKEVGSTSLTVFGANRRLLAVVDLSVHFDAQGLKAKLSEVVPDARVEVRAVNNAVILSGSVASSEELARVVSVAEAYAPQQVRNLLKVDGSQQVMLQVRLAEIARETAKNLGFKNSLLFGDFALTTLDNINPLNFVAASLRLTPGNNLVDLVIDALEDKRLLKTLAEPNLIALSGQTARFLAGGEFPVPVNQDNDRITIEFKEFGVGLAFTPTVLEDGLMNIVVAPEVSQIDTTTSISTISGVAIPGLSTRRAETTVELRDGQSFAIAGLLQNDMNDRIRQIPFLGDVPILGALFRSTSFQRNETELVIIVPPRLVRPAAAGTVAAPTDRFVPPSDFQLFFMGQLEGPPRADGATPARGHAVGELPDRRAVDHLLDGQRAAGVDGPHGHILQ
jgi:pilus assembly protein CpaC